LAFGGRSAFFGFFVSGWCSGLSRVREERIAFGYNSPAQPSEGTKVALPVADTPVIQRNKEFRGGKFIAHVRQRSLPFDVPESIKKLALRPRMLKLLRRRVKWI
jgi:hypothetical protein